MFLLLPLPFATGVYPLPLCSYSPLHTTFSSFTPPPLTHLQYPPPFFSPSLLPRPHVLVPLQARQHHAPTATALADAHRLSPFHCTRACVCFADSRRCTVRVVGGVGGRTRDTSRWWGRERVIGRGDHLPSFLFPLLRMVHAGYRLPRARFSAPATGTTVSPFSFFSRRSLGFSSHFQSCD